MKIENPTLRTAVLCMVIFGGMVVALVYHHAIQNSRSQCEIDRLRTLNADLLLLNAESDPLYVAFNKAFPDASRVDMREPKRRLGRDDIDTVYLLQLDATTGESLPMGGYLCTVAPRHGHSGLRVHVKVERVTMKTSENAAWGHSESVSLQDLQKRVDEAPTSRSSGT